MDKLKQLLIALYISLGLYKKFTVFYADPPWSKNQKGKYGAINHYDLMTMERIEQMPIEYLAADNAFLFLWTPQGLIPEALKVIEKWGFRYVDEMIWDKYNLGLGKYVRHTHETLLIGVRGKPEVMCKNQPSLIRAPRQDHSHKPEEFTVIIERLVKGPYIELFARRKPSSGRPDEWYVWGNEIASDIYIPGYPVPEYNKKAALPAGNEATEIVQEIEKLQEEAE